MMLMLHRVVFATLMSFSLSAMSTGSDQMFWFKNEVQCAGEKIVIRSYCEVSFRENASVQVNNVCTEQELTFQIQGGKQHSVDLLNKEPWKGDMHVVSFLQCVSLAQRRYFLLRYDNGGNCDTCELEALLGNDGKWKRYGNKSFPMSRAEKFDIDKHLVQWQQVPSVQITNAVKDTRQER